MGSLAELPELVGFFSYARRDDELSGQALSLLRKRIADQLALLLGRDVRLWQDKEAIPHGTLWQERITGAIAESAFFIPIITPRAIASEHCQFEFNAFLRRERELRRDDLVFPVLYIPVPALDDEQQRRQDAVLSIIHARQYADWREIWLDDVTSTEVGRRIARFCRDIVEALRKSWESPEERGAREEAEARAGAEQEERRKAAEAEALRLAEAARARAEAEEARARAEQERRLVEAEADTLRRAEAERRRAAEAEARRQAEAQATAEREAAERRRRAELWAARKQAWTRLPGRKLALVLGACAVVAAAASYWALIEYPARRQAAQQAEIQRTAREGELQRLALEAETRRAAQEQAAREVENQRAAQEQAANQSAAQSPAAAALSPERERALQPKDSFRECDNCPEMVVVPAGSFTMGSPDGEKDRSTTEGPQHDVKISKPFAVGKFHVTVDQFAGFVAQTHYDAGSTCWTFEGGKYEERSGRSWRNPGFPQEGSHPAVCLNWNDAKAYVDWLAEKTRKPYRLLTEAEWEYAARGRPAPGRYPRFWFGNDDKELCAYGNGADQTARDTIEGAKGWTVAPCNDGYAYTSPAGHFPANGFGLHDMFGNAWQWTADCWHDSYKDAPSDGSAWTTGDCIRRVVRGGSWGSSPGGLRAAARVRDTDRDYGLGFRLGRTLTP